MRSLLRRVAVPCVLVLATAGLLAACNPYPGGDGSLVYRGTCSSTDGTRHVQYAIWYYQRPPTEPTWNLSQLKAASVSGLRANESVGFSDVGRNSYIFYFQVDTNSPLVAIPGVRPAPGKTFPSDPQHSAYAAWNLELEIPGHSLGVCEVRPPVRP